MATQYKVISEWLCFTTAGKARKIERHLNTLSAEGWEFVALDAVTWLGCDLGFYLVLKRVGPQSSAAQT
jgi:hypothetical protein